MNKQVNVILLAVIAILLSVQVVMSFTGGTSFTTSSSSDNEVSSNTSTPTTDATLANLNDPNSTPPVGENPEPAAPTGPTTTITFDKADYDFGKITDGDIVDHEFTFTNTGTNPLIITNAKGSCGCTVPEYPKNPVPPGGTGSIKVQFNSKGKVGVKNNSVTLTANTEPADTYLRITADVQPGS